jgi:hypothetical protein
MGVDLVVVFVLRDDEKYAAKAAEIRRALASSMGRGRRLRTQKIIVGDLAWRRSLR